MIELLGFMEQWYEAHKEGLAERGVASQFSLGPPDRPKRGACIDLETDDQLVRLLVWESGEAELESAAIPDEQTFEHLTLTSTEELEAALVRLVDRIR